MRRPCRARTVDMGPGSAVDMGPISTGDKGENGLGTYLSAVNLLSHAHAVLLGRDIGRSPRSDRSSSAGGPQASELG